jgi:hypothetical protein
MGPGTATFDMAPNSPLISPLIPSVKKRVSGSPLLPPVPKPRNQRPPFVLPPQQFVTEGPWTAFWKHPAVARSSAIELPLYPVPAAKFPPCADQRVPILSQPFCALNATGLDNRRQLKRQKMRLIDAFEIVEATFTQQRQ